MTIRMRPLLNFVSSKVWFELGMGTPLWYIIVRGIILRGDKILFVKRYYTLYGCVSYIRSYRKIRERIKEWHLFWYDNKASVRRGWDITLYTYGMRNHLEDILFGTRNHLIVRYQDISYAEDILFGMRTKQYWIPGIGKPHVSNFIVCFVD